jgi:tetratricopeptide (TPR) repeat protein
MVRRTWFLGVLLVLSVVSSAVAQDQRDALALYRAGRFQEAVEVTLDEIEETPRNMDSYAVLCWSLLGLNRYEDALQWGERALQISRFDHRLVGVVAEANYALGNNIEALDALEEYVAIAPTGTLIPVVYYMMGEIFLRFGEFFHADIALTTAVYHNGTNARWWTRLGFAREQAEAYESAREAYNRAIQLSPGGGAAEARRGLERLPVSPSG